MNSIKLYNRMDIKFMITIFTSDFYRLLLNLLDIIDLKRSDKYVALSNLSMH